MLKLVADLLAFAGPLVLNALVQFIDDATEPMLFGTSRRNLKRANLELPFELWNIALFACSFFFRHCRKC